jgi:peptidoglycan hydrolase-like protein with peptidoglycan-binding domain
MKKIYSIFMFMCVFGLAQTTHAVFNTNEVATGEEKIENVYLLKKTLKPGLIDDEVIKLQNVLIASGYLSLPTKSLGYYGPETVTAVKKLQADNGIETIGTVGPKTITTINTLLSKVPETSGDITTNPTGAVVETQTTPTNYTFTDTMGLGAKGTEVTKLQNYLRSNGYFKGPSTGYFGFQTREALSQYQRANKVSEYGSVGPKTVRVLNGEKIDTVLDITQRELALSTNTGSTTQTTTNTTTTRT